MPGECSTPIEPFPLLETFRLPMLAAPSPVPTKLAVSCGLLCVAAELGALGAFGATARVGAVLIDVAGVWVGDFAPALVAVPASAAPCIAVPALCTAPAA
jgi:hypothetical protein